MTSDGPVDPKSLRPSVPETEVDGRRRHSARRHAMARWSKRVLLGVGAAAVAGAVIWAWLPRPVPVEVGTVRRGTLRVEVEEDGRTRVRARYVVAAPATGTLRRVTLAAGDIVERGDALARITPPDPTLLDERTRADAEARLAAAGARERQARTSVGRARDALAQAAREADRARALSPNGVTVAELERAELAERDARAALAASEMQAEATAADVRAVRAILGRTIGSSAGEIVLAAPVAGRVLRIVRDSEGPIVAGAPIVELGDVRAIEIVVDLLSADAARIAVGASATIEDWGGAPLTGRVQLVEPSGSTRISALGVEEQRVNVIVALADPPAALGDGFRVGVRVEAWKGEGVLTVPASAIFRSGDGWSVFVVSGELARLRPVELGHRGRADVQIVRGLVEGERVVLYPGERVQDGAEVASR